MNYLTVRGWDRYQHYKDRDPPWVKLYRDILTTESWVLGDDTSRLIQVASILLAARYSNQIPLQWTLIRKVASLDCSEKEFNAAVSHLVSTNFLEIQQVTTADETAARDASTALATCPSEERREETEQSRADKTRASARPAKRCPADFVLDAELRTWAAEKFPDVSLDAATEAFRDHEYATAKSDWRAAWRTWIRNTPKFGASNGAHRRNGQQKPSAVESVERSTAEWAQRRGVDPASI